MTWWIDPRHPEESSPLHPTSYEESEGARLYLDEKKAARARRDMRPDDTVFLYETAKNPQNRVWRGASSVGALVMVDSAPYPRPDAHSNALMGRAEDWKVDASWIICLRDWSQGVSINELRRILGYSSPWAPRSLAQITQRQYEDLRSALGACKQSEGAQSS